MTSVVIENDRRGFVRQRLPEVIQDRQINAMQGLRAFMQGGMEKSGPIHNDTGALSEGLYIKSARGSDYETRRASAQSAYVGSDSKWRDAVRMLVSPDAYSAAHFAERAADEAEIENDDDDIVTMLACMMAYGYWWQYGHENRFTKKWEQRSWFIEPIAQWWPLQAERYFANIENDLI